LFEKDPMNREVGLRYRKLMLEPGGSKSGMDVLEDVLGRKPNAEARYKELGLTV
jgi:metallopeptidase MepB